MDIFVNGIEFPVHSLRVTYGVACELAGINPESHPQVSFQASPPFGPWRNLRPGQSVSVPAGSAFVVNAAQACCHEQQGEFA